MKWPWLRNTRWETIVQLNAGLCQQARADHKPTSDGYEKTRNFWLENHERELTLAEAVEICRKCHLLAPFCNYNGNTFVVVIRDCIRHAPGFTPEQRILARSLAGHLVAGTAEPGEAAQFQQILHDVEHGTATAPATPLKAGDRVKTPKGSLTGTVIRVNPNGTITWKADQTDAELTGSPETVLPLT